MCVFLHIQYCHTSCSVKMPQTNKSVSSGSGPGQGSAPDQGQPPPASADVKAQVAAEDGGEGISAEDKGDTEIIKSPSDPKTYRWRQVYWV